MLVLQKKISLKSVIIGLTLFTFAGCGGGGGNKPEPEPTDENQIINLSKLQSKTLGTIYNATLTGSDTNGITYDGSITISNRAQTMLNGVLVTPQDSILSLTGGGASFTVTATSNVDTSGNLISIVVQTIGLTCTPVSPDHIPTSVKIGDFGILSTLNCSDNTFEERNWRVENAGNGNINLISNGTIRDQFNTIISVTDVTLTIDSDGNVAAFKTVSTQATINYTLTYESS